VHGVDQLTIRDGGSVVLDIRETIETGGVDLSGRPRLRAAGPEAPQLQFIKGSARPPSHSTPPIRPAAPHFAAWIVTAAL
jgi:hypothetical protein